jgi:hypothetical protein
MEVSGQLHVPTASSPRKEVTANLLARDSDYTAGFGWKWIYLTMILLIRNCFKYSGRFAVSCFSPLAWLLGTLSA